jgi:aldose sugar dehydrogenase
VPNCLSKRKTIMMKRRTLLFSAPSLALFSLASAAEEPFAPSLVPLAKGLDHPWGMAFLPDGSLLVTERQGRLRRLSLQDNALSEPIAGTPDVDNEGQGGLLGIALDPDFASNRLVYLSFSEAREGGNATAMFRGRLRADNDALEDGKTIFRQNMAVESDKHFGSRLVFDREGYLFVTTGERGYLPQEAQNPASHLGKVLRVTREGAPAPGNPALPGWAPEVWSIGHRNVQGAALNPNTGQLWTAEHGAKGGDEINTPRAGKNYGWPIITYGRNYSGATIGEGVAKVGMEQPLHYWDPSIAPSGMTFVTQNLYPGWQGSVIVGALAGTHLARLSLDGEKILAEEKLFEGFGRFRDVVEGPDGRIYALIDAASPDGGVYVIAAPGEVTATPAP